MNKPFLSNAPRRFGLSATNRGIVITYPDRIHEDLERSLKRVIGRQYHAGVQSLQEFSGFGRGNWGLRGCLAPPVQDGLNRRIVCRIPKIFGSNCDGMYQGSALIVSLAVLMDIFEQLEIEPSDDDQSDVQLVSKIHTPRSGFGLSTYLDDSVHDWLRRQPNGKLKEPTEMLSSAISTMWQDADLTRVLIEVTNAQLLIWLPDGCWAITNQGSKQLVTSDALHSAHQLGVLYGLTTVLGRVPSPATLVR